MNNEIGITTAFIGGILSFFSPCILPLIPVYISLFTGLSTAEISKGSSRLRILFHTLMFVAGFSTIYVAMGVGSSIIGSIFIDYQDIWRVIGGLILILFGILLIGLIKSGFLMREFRININLHKMGTPIGAFLIGVGFAAGWSPCIGPILGSILVYSSMSGNLFAGVKILGAYSLGIAIPFIISSMLIDATMRYLKRYVKIFRWINYILGVILIILGLFMILGVSF
ncbi:MAG: cytochrome c biogenesis protein CcdA [Thermodesulfovibrio sp.]|nr:cytochrome c biogenesis protein CcdA [Thermodesulfovibrio sp.]